MIQSRRLYTVYGAYRKFVSFENSHWSQQHLLAENGDGCVGLAVAHKVKWIL
jgi:hypothetical protein